jgi:hypothetical protein
VQSDIIIGWDLSEVNLLTLQRLKRKAGSGRVPRIQAKANQGIKQMSQRPQRGSHPSLLSMTQTSLIIPNRFSEQKRQALAHAGSKGHIEIDCLK